MRRMMGTGRKLKINDIISNVQFNGEARVFVNDLHCEGFSNDDIVEIIVGLTEAGYNVNKEGVLGHINNFNVTRIRN